MRILAIDPGPDNFHWVELEWSDFGAGLLGVKFKTESLDTWESWPTQSNTFFDGVVIERPLPYGVNLSKHLERTIRVVGRLEQFYRERCGAPILLGRKAAIGLLGLPGNCGDSNVNTLIWSEFGDGTRKSCVGTKKEPGPFYGFKRDYWQAFALGWAYYLKLKEESDGRSD